MFIFCKEKFEVVIFHFQSKTFLTFFSHFFAIFRALNLGYGKNKQNHIVKCLADVLSFMYFPQRNTLESNILWLVLKIDKKMQKMTGVTIYILSSHFRA